MRKKSELPFKECATCGRPFVWRKKWEKTWAEVRYCSERCRRDRKKGGAGVTEGARPLGPAVAPDISPKTD